MSKITITNREAQDIAGRLLYYPESDMLEECLAQLFELKGETDESVARQLVQKALKIKETNKHRKVLSCVPMTKAQYRKWANTIAFSY